MSFFTRLSKAAPAIKRSYATVADASGVKVAGIEGGAAPGTSSITVVVKAGSRYETKPGVAHVLKNFAYKVGGLGDGAD
jgi:ubiquinol-cytochrome c reductase core subunit 2